MLTTIVITKETREKLKNLGFEPLNKRPFYNEFLMKTPKSTDNILSKLLEKKIVGGINLGENKMLISCTEMNSLHDIESYVSIVRQMK